jgi:hypothetical protein
MIDENFDLMLNRDIFMDDLYTLLLVCNYSIFFINCFNLICGIDEFFHLFILLQIIITIQFSLLHPFFLIIYNMNL